MNINLPLQTRTIQNAARAVSTQVLQPLLSPKPLQLAAVTRLSVMSLSLSSRILTREDIFDPATGKGTGEWFVDNSPQNFDQNTGHYTGPFGPYKWREIPPWERGQRQAQEAADRMAEPVLSRTLQDPNETPAKRAAAKAELDKINERKQTRLTQGKINTWGQNTYDSFVKIHYPDGKYEAPDRPSGLEKVLRGLRIW